jgi:hypothetical protein
MYTKPLSTIYGLGHYQVIASYCVELRPQQWLWVTLTKLTHVIQHVVTIKPRHVTEALLTVDMGTLRSI